MSGRNDFETWLTATAGRRRRAALWRGGAAGVVAVAAALALAAAADRVLAPSGWALVTLAFASLLLAAAIAAVLLVRASSREPRERVAALADHERPEFEDRVKTAVDLIQRSEPGMFDDLVLAQTTRQVAAADLPLTNDDAGATRGMRLAIAAVLALVIAAAAAWPTLRDAGTTAGILMFPGGLELEVAPGDARVPIGKPMTIAARASRLPRAFGRDLPLLTITTDANTASGEMAAGDGSFSYVTAPVTQSFTYKVAFGTAVSREYRVEALPYPSVKAIDLSYRYPAWSGLQPREEKDGGDVYGPEGTRVGLQVTFDKPARAAALVMADGTRVPLTLGGNPLVAETTMTLAKDSAYRVEVTDTDGLNAADDTEYFIRVMDDAPPDVRITRPSGDQRVTPLAEVAIEARAEDDHGVRSLELVYSVRGQGERVVPLPARGGERAVEGRHLIYLEDLKVKPGDFVSFHARARDVARGKASTEGRSDIFFLEVKPFEEEFAAAQSMAQAGAGAAARQLQGLAAAQKEIIVATWKLERRSGAGRSGTDIKAVARAQRELRQRTAQTAARAGAPGPQARRGRRGGLPPEPAAAAPDEEQTPAVLLARAGEAMERATTELDGSRPKAALDHENAALNELLRIEAQIRRREIQQAQNQAAGGGGQTGNQDLSALFDRELQRQQQTNYENRANARADEQQQQEQESEALKRVREMAQRQEALRRQQEELARANLTPEERQRRLERLRRDQEQLQRQVEQLARQIDQQQGQPQGQQGQQAQQGQSGQQGRSGQSSAREASQAMSEAAGSLGREELERAGQQGARAAEALRNLEREMRQREQGGQSRALNDARLEAQQLAEAQRRLADDAARVARSGSTPDAARRLAGEKERLAERLDALGRQLDAAQRGQSSQARRQPGSRQSDQAARDAAAASRRLAREQRAAAENWRREQGAAQGNAQGNAQGARGNQAQGKLAEGESRMAADLEQLARRLGAPPSGAGEADTRRLANELDEARATRERLADLERQITDMRRQAEAGQRGQGDDAPRRLEDLQRQFGREAQRASELANRQGGAQSGRVNGARREGAERGDGAPASDGAGRGAGDPAARNDGRSGTPEEAWSPSRSAPGTQQWKQDFSKWESMRRNVAQALESYEASLTAKLAEKLAAERVHAGYDARTPEAWRKLVADYYEAIARRRDR